MSSTAAAHGAIGLLPTALSLLYR